MEINYEIGKLYDTVFYLTCYFYKDTAHQQIFEKYGDSVYNLKTYYEFLESAPRLDLSLAPLCYLAPNSINSFISVYLSVHLNWATTSFDQFISLFNNRGALKKAFIDYYFSDMNQQERQFIFGSVDFSKMCDILDNRTVNPCVKISFLQSIIKFDQIHELFMESLHTIYEYVNEFHLSHHDEIMKTINNILNPTLKDLKKAGKFNNAAYTDIIGISLLNPALIFPMQYKNQKDFVFLLGTQFDKSLPQFMTSSDISLLSFAEMFSNPNKKSTYDLFKEYGALSTSDISNALSLTKSASYAIVEAMLSERLIYVSYISKGKMFYSLNPDYLIASLEKWRCEVTSALAKLKRNKKKRYFTENGS